MDDLARWLESNGYARAEHGARRRRLCVARRHPRPLPARRAGADQARFLRRHARIDPRLRSRDAAHRRPTALARSRADERGAAHDRNDPPLPPGLRRANSARRAATTTLYAAVSEGRRAIGLEHWLPLLYDRLDTLFDYVGDAPIVLDARAEEAADAAHRADRRLLRRAPRSLSPGADARPTTSRCRPARSI